MAAAMDSAAPSGISGDVSDIDEAGLGELDITTESLSGIEQELQAFKDSEVLRAILDEGTCDRSGGTRADKVLRACRADGQPAAAGGAAPAPPLLSVSLPLLPGVDPREYARRYEEKLRAAEMESIQDYLGEAEALAALHAQVPGAADGGGACAAIVTA